MFSLLVSAFNKVKPFRGKQKILKALFRWVPFFHARSYYGVRMVNNVHDSTWRACMVGSYGTFISDYIKSLSSPFVFLDIGSNQGLFGLCAAGNPCCDRVIAFEPNPNTFALLVGNIALLDNPEKVHPVCAAIGRQDDYLIDMIVPVNHSGASTLSTAAGLGGRQFKALTIHGRHIAELARPEQNVQIHAKIDVEGAEIIVLQQLLESSLLNKISSVIIEISANIEGADHVNDIKSFFEKQGWVLTSRSSGADHYDAIYRNPLGI